MAKPISEDLESSTISLLWDTLYLEQCVRRWWLHCVYTGGGGNEEEGEEGEEGEASYGDTLINIYHRHNLSLCPI